MSAAETDAWLNSGLLSAVWIGRRLFLVQTEVVQGEPALLVRSIVTACGSVLLKRQRTAEAGSANDLARIVREEHARLETELRGRLASLAEAKARAGRDDCYRHFELGMAAYSQGDYEAALAHWRSARSLSPQLPSLEISVRAAEARLASR